MAIKEVLMIGNSKLRDVAESIKASNSETNRIIFDLEDTLRFLQKEKKVGRALAAPQIGYSKRIIFANLPNRQILMINPEIVSKSKETFEVWDSCFSFDIAFFVKVKRFKSITVKYFDEDFVEKQEVFKESQSELFQHEIDHLDGILATDRLQDCKNIILRSEWEKLQEV